MLDTHTDICEWLKIDDSSPAPTWAPFAVQKTKVEIFVNGERVRVYGSGMRCGECGYGIDFKPTTDYCPRCRIKEL